jgi:hypothetical protein
VAVLLRTHDRSTAKTSAVDPPLGQIRATPKNQPGEDMFRSSCVDRSTDVPLCWSAGWLIRSVVELAKPGLPFPRKAAPHGTDPRGKRYLPQAVGLGQQKNPYLMGFLETAS